MVHAVAAPRKNSRKKRQAATLPLPGLPTRKAGCPDTDPPWAQNKHLRDFIYLATSPQINLGRYQLHRGKPEQREQREAAGQRKLISPPRRPDLRTEDSLSQPSDGPTAPLPTPAARPRPSPAPRVPPREPGAGRVPATRRRGRQRRARCGPPRHGSPREEGRAERRKGRKGSPRGEPSGKAAPPGAPRPPRGAPARSRAARSRLPSAARPPGPQPAPSLPQPSPARPPAPSLPAPCPRLTMAAAGPS